MNEQHRRNTSRWSTCLAAVMMLFVAYAMYSPKTAWAAPGTGDADRSAASPWHVDWELELEYESERNYNLDNSDDEDGAVFQPELDVEVGYQPSPWFQGFVRLEWSRNYGAGGPKAETGDTGLELAEAYLASEGISVPVGGELSLYLGRRLFRDERQWLQDEQLDGVTLQYDYKAWSLSLSATRQRNKDLLNQDGRDKTDNFMAYGRYQFDDHVFGAYVLKRRERDGGDGRPLFVGIQSYGELTSSIDYWLELAAARGQDDEGSIRGWGFDSAVIYRFEASLSPSLILGYAVGSGDRGNDDGVNRAFRQTGMQDNEHDLGGLVGFRYLGVVLEPELSNIRVLTAGLGLRPHDRVSMQLLFHRYRQEHANETLGDTNLDADPNGTDRDLGYGIDLAVGAEVGEAIDIEAIAGYFLPGNAFSDNSGNAFFLGTKIEYKF